MYHNQLAALAQDYCILDTHNLFVCTTLEDEILVLGGKQELLTGLAGQCCNFGFSLETHFFQEVILCPIVAKNMR